MTIPTIESVFVMLTELDRHVKAIQSYSDAIQSKLDTMTHERDLLAIELNQLRDKK